MKHAQVKLPDGRIKHVKNLGWVRRNWQQVQRLEWVNFRDDGDTRVMRPEGVFRAYLHDGRVFAIPYADFSVFCWFVNRPIFRGLQLTVNGITGRV